MNKFNLFRWQRGLSPGGGCAGHGCGAAFDFVALGRLNAVVIKGT